MYYPLGLLLITVIFSKFAWNGATECWKFIFAGTTLISKAALNDGMKFLVFNCYRHILSTFVLAPFALFFERDQKTPLSFLTLCKIFLIALCGPTVTLNLQFYSLQMLSATIAYAIYNTTPVLTFIIALLLRLETVSWRSSYGVLKIVGMITSVGGTMVLSFYRGPPLEHAHTSMGMGSNSSSEFGNGKSRILGPLLMFLSAVTFSLWLTLQAKVLEIYPAKLRLNTLQWLFSALQTAVIALSFERKLDSWKIGWNIQLVFLAYVVVLVSVVQYGLQSWCFVKKGPFFVAVFFPLGLLITAIFSRFAWNERLSIGSLLGAILIIGGLYCVLSARAKEKNNNQPTAAKIPANPCQPVAPENRTRDNPDLQTA